MNPAYPVSDGFLLNTHLRCNLRFRSMVLAEFEALRRAGSYRSKYWVVPRDSNIAIPARNSFEYQENVVPGSALWGFLWTQSGNAGPFSFQVREACTKVPLFSEVVRADNFSASISGDEPAPVAYPFGRLLIVPTPGLISIEICSQQTTDATGVQLVLCGGEPMCPE